jgi:integrase
MIGRKEDGRRNLKSFYGMTKKEIRQKVLDWRKSQAEGTICKKDYTFAEWADMWFEIHKDNISRTTQESYQYTLRMLKRHFGKKLLSQIKAYDIDMFIHAQRNEGRAHATLAKYKGMMYQIMHKAEANDLIAKNPAKFAEKIRRREIKKKKDAFTAEEVKIMMRELPNDRIGMSVRLMLGTGMRSQELLALEPKHIAPDGSSITIEQAVVLVKGTVYIGPPKSLNSNRIIPVPPSLWNCAKKLRETNKKFIWEERKANCPCNPSFFRDEFKRALEGLHGVRVLTPHSCRHTYVSQMQALGVDVSTIQSLVGHAEIDMTEYYLHVQDSIRKEAVQRFSNAFAIDLS